MEQLGWNDRLRQSGQNSSNSSTMASDNNLLTSNHLHDNTNNNKEECNRNFLLQQDVQAVVSEKGKQKIQSLLDQVYDLLPIEQLLLYLKLPTEHAGAVDPLRQSMNPLGSRSEINQTIIWIQTHLEEDKELSLQKKGVYDDYVAFCEPNGIKPLSTADFGKVMKQVYPNVRPRRLGTRGQSKYCYSGLRSRVKLDAPLLPDLSEKTMSTESNCTQSDYMAAAWYIIKEWAEEKLSMQFKSAISLAYYLVKELSIAIGSEAAQLVTTLATSTCNDNTHYGYISRHKETTMQLQRKIQQTKETKRKQIQSEKNDQQKFRSKKFKGSPPSTSCSTSPIVPMDNKGSPQSNEYSNCDSANHSLPDFNSFHRPAPTAETTFAEKEPPIQSKANYSIGKAGINRTAKQSPSKRSKNNKYKVIQPKPDFCDIGSFDSKVLLDNDMKPMKQKIKKEEPLSFFPNEVSDPYFSRERLESVSQVSKDALDEYLGTSNSQEPEEEIIKYLGNEEETKLTQLRELLVQNCPSSSNSAFTATKATRKLSSKSSLLAGNVQNINVKRRVSFDTNVQDECGFRNTSVRRDDVNFIPISSPTGKHSMSSSANVSPFVSPRNTPVMRSRGNMHLHPAKSTAQAKYRGEKMKRPNLELKINPDAVDFRNQLVNLPMSAPPSPKTYGYAGSKYYPNVHTNFPPHILDEPMVNDGNKLNMHNSFRSQSVPVNAEQNQMYSAFNYPPTNLARDINELNDGLNVNDMMNDMESMPGDLHMFPSRSVPNTPVPYNHTVDFHSFEKAHTTVSSKSYPTTPLASETFTYGQSHDYLLNGQPIKEKPNLNFIQTDDTSNTMYSTYSDGDMIDANKNVNLEQNIADCELKSNIDDLFKVVPD